MSTPISVLWSNWKKLFLLRNQYILRDFCTALTITLLLSPESWVIHLVRCALFQCVEVCWRPGWIRRSSKLNNFESTVVVNHVSLFSVICTRVVSTRTCPKEKECVCDIHAHAIVTFLCAFHKCSVIHWFISTSFIFRRSLRGDHLKRHWVRSKTKKKQIYKNF